MLHGRSETTLHGVKGHHLLVQYMYAITHHLTSTHPSMYMYMYFQAHHVHVQCSYTALTWCIVPVVVFEGSLHSLWKSFRCWRERADPETRASISYYTVHVCIS